MNPYPRTCYHCGSSVHALQTRDSNDDLVCNDCRAAQASDVFRSSKEIPTFKLEHDHLALGPFQVDASRGGCASYITPRFGVWSQLQDIRFVVTEDGEAETFGTVHALDPAGCFVSPHGEGLRLPAPETLLIFEATFPTHGRAAATNHFTTLAGAFTWLQWSYNQRNA